MSEDVLQALAAFGLADEGIRIERSPTGLIQATYFATLPGDRRVVVQRMHPVFGESVLEDIDAVTAELERHGFATPRPLRTPRGALVVHDSEGRLWRVLTWLDGFTLDRVELPIHAERAAALVARFHRRLATWERPFSFVRSGVHDTAAHLARLAAARTRERAGGDARLLDLADEILDEALHLPALPELPRRVAHGDLKISNVLFAGDRASPHAVALLDLDTLGRMTIAYELGDAWRSWCNPMGEDAEETRFDLEIFAAAARGYGGEADGLLAPEEIGALVTGVRTVAVELAARFCVDAFEDRYFGWDPARFPTRREHNRVRATGQLSLARSVGAASDRAEEIVRAAFAGQGLTSSA